MQQRQLRLGDILDDYCPRERRVTNHAVVAMVGPDVKQTRCTTCDAEHVYKHAKVPRQRRKSEPPALYAQGAAGGPKRSARRGPATPLPNGSSASEAETTESPMASVAFDALTNGNGQPPHPLDAGDPGDLEQSVDSSARGPVENSGSDGSIENLGVVEIDERAENDENQENEDERDDGPVHRPLIRASLPRPEGQAPSARPVPDFTIRQPGGRPNRFRPRHQHEGGGQMFHGNRSNGNTGGGSSRGGGIPRHGGGHRSPPMKRHGGGRKGPK